MSKDKCWLCGERDATHQETGEDDGFNYVVLETCDPCCMQWKTEEAQDACICGCLHSSVREDFREAVVEWLDKYLDFQNAFLTETASSQKTAVEISALGENLKKSYVAVRTLLPEHATDDTLALAVKTLFSYTKTSLENAQAAWKELLLAFGVKTDENLMPMVHVIEIEKK